MLTSETAGRIVEIISSGLQREYPYHLVHAVTDRSEIRPPRKLTPAFYGSFDWHSSVHSHWSLVRLVRLFPNADWAIPVRAALAQDLTAEAVRGEVAYLSAPHRVGFERPYGLAWLLQLAAELHEGSADPQMAEWGRNLSPLVELAVQRLTEWLPRLTHPIRSGEHSQTAFAMGLAWDWARLTGDSAFESLLAKRALDFYLRDRDAPVRYEPSGHDFLSAILGEADLLRRILPAAEFSDWLDGFLPGLRTSGSNMRKTVQWLRPVVSPDSSDGKFSHLNGLNLSRAWMLRGVCQVLPELDVGREGLEMAAQRQADAGLAAVTGEHYAGAHWLGSFAVYLLTDRGL